MTPAIKDYQLTEVDDADVEYEFASSNFGGANASLIPMPSAVQPTRVFYGSRFIDQALPLRGAEAPLVQSLSDDGERSYEEIFGANNGASFSDDDGVVKSVSPSEIVWTDSTGQDRVKKLFVNFPFNRKSALHQTPLVQPGQKITKNQVLARSNFTDDRGTLALGMNARVGIVPYLGYSMDDATVVSQSFANKLTSESSQTIAQEFDENTKTGRNHFSAVLPTEYKKDQIDRMDEDGVVTPGTILKPGDPIILATRPKVFSSSTIHLGKLGKSMRQVRSNASQVWDGEDEAEVVDVAKTKKGFKVILRSYSPTRDADKIVFRAGAKGVTSKIIPDDQMPRTADGKPLDVLYNPLGLVSRANDQMVYEVLLGKIAALKGKPIKVPAFTKHGENWYDFVGKMLADNGVSETEKVYDPKYGRWLERPITVGNAYMLKLHHTAHSKSSARGAGGSYTADEQPSKGGDAGSKRVSGLEVASWLSSGAVHNLGEVSRLRGQRNPEYWQQLRQGLTPKDPGAPFVWRKYRALLEGAGLRNKDMGGGRVRLGPMTDRRLAEMNPVTIQNGGIVNLNTMEPDKGGLFDPSMVATNRWGAIDLPRPVINPAFYDVVRHLMNLKGAELEDILAGRAELPERLRGKKSAV